MGNERPPGRLIDGTALAGSINQLTEERATALRRQGIEPCLAVVHVGESGAAASYRKQITQQAQRIGLSVRDIGLATAADDDALDATITGLNEDEEVHGVLVQTPLSPALQRVVLFRLSTDKDPEGVTPRHLGMLFLGRPEVLPCTPAAIIAIIKSCRDSLAGARVVVINGSPIIGRPLAMLLIDEGATPIICTEHTRELAVETRRAQILVVAAGHPHFIGPDFIAPGTLVIDAAINRLPDGSLVGDVDTATVRPLVSAITPVPGGVGPVTTAMLLANVSTLAALHRGRPRHYS